MNPNDKALREEYKKLQAIKSAKEKERFQKVSGFFNTKALEDLQEEDEKEALLREKIKRQTFQGGIWAKETYNVHSEAMRRTYSKMK